MNRRAMAEPRILSQCPRLVQTVRAARFPLAPALALGLALTLGLAACNPAGGSGEQPPLAGAALGGNFALQDKTGKTVHFADFDGKYRIVYFGYTFCPDVCPLDLQNVMQGINLFARNNAEAAARIQPIFITVDPARDTPQVVGEFTAHFGAKLLGLSGSEKAIAEAEKSFAVYAQKREGGAGTAYLMDHSRAAYLMGPKGEPIALLPAEQNAEAVRAELAKWVK